MLSHVRFAGRMANFVWLILSLIVVIALTIAATACSTPREQEKVTLRLDWRLVGYQAPFFWALDKGYYTSKNLDVTIGDGQGSANTVQIIGSGTETFGFADIPTMIQGVARGMPIKAVATILPTSPNAILYLSETGIKASKDLEGKKMGFAPGSVESFGWPAFVKANGIDENKVGIVSTDLASKLQVLFTKKVDFILTTINQKPRGKAQGVDIDALLLADYGLPMAGFALITQTDTIKNRPDMVKDFVEATLRAWKEAKDKPDEMVNLMHGKYRPDMAMPLSIEDIKVYLPLTESPNTKGKPLGWSSDKDWQQTVDIMAKFSDMSKTPALSELFTNDFIPGR